MRTKHSILFILFLVAIVLQGCSLKARIKKADKQFATGEYYAAGERYRRLASKIPGNKKTLRARVMYNQGECYRMLNFRQAEQAYANSIKNKYSDSIVYLRYAQVLQRNGKYADAARNYAIYLTKDSSNQQAKNGINILKQINEWKSQPSSYVVNRFDAFNVRRSHTFCPMYMPEDDDMLFFTSDRTINKKVAQKSSSITGQSDNNIYMVRKNASGKWEKPEVLGSEVNSLESDDGACSFSPDGKIMYFTRARQQEDAELGTEIFYSNRAGGAWSEPKEIVIFKDSSISVAHPAISPDGETIYFVSDNKKGKGGKDIWKGKLEKGECKEIENLGPQINTSGDEMFPTVREDGTLYFSSNGLPGLGGLDIFKATPIKDGGWKVENMGIPVNSNGDDFGMTFEEKAEKGFFSSNRGDNRGNDAIWRFDLPVYEYILTGKVVDEQSNPIPDALVRLVSNSGLNARVLSKKDGTYRIKLDKDIECVMMASARGYLNKEGKVSTKGLRQSKTFTYDFQLSTIFKPIQVENIFYEFGKWNLTPASEGGLMGLVKVLKDNPNITIEISAHTDFVGNNEDNKVLSEKRAKSVVDYLIAAGIAANRLTSVGYGEEKPFVVDAQTAAKYTYLKENDVLDEAFVIKLTPEQQEQANQINRRTEFRVVKTTYKQ